MEQQQLSPSLSPSVSTSTSTSSPSSSTASAPTSTTVTTTRARTTSVSATAAILHHNYIHPHTNSNSNGNPTSLQQQQDSPFHHMHPWSTERSKVAAESEISPPISPKQQAVLGGPQGGDFVEPLQESNCASPSLARHPSLSHAWDSDSSANAVDNSNDDGSTANSPRSSSDDTVSHSRSSSNSLLLSHPNSPYTHHHQHPRQRSMTTISNSANSDIALEPMSTTGLLLSRSDLSAPTSSSSSSSASVVSSASSSSTSLSSVSSKAAEAGISLSSVSSSSASAVDHHAQADNQYQSSPPSLQKLEIEQMPSELFLIDTPPSSHVPSPSSPVDSSYAILKGILPFNLSTSSKTTTLTKKTTTTTRAPWHCTRKSIPQIIREISDVVDGRDKTIKVIQYFAKVFLWLFLSNPTQYKVLATRIKALAKQFSTTRKVLRLGHFVDPMSSVATLAVALRASMSKHGLRRTVFTKLPAQSWKDTMRDRLGSLNSLIGFCQDISDDIYCLGVIGVLDRDFSDKAEPWSNRLWMVGVSIDLHENLQTIRDVRRQIRVLEEAKAACTGTAEEERVKSAQVIKLRTKLHWLQVTTVKLGGDFLFCAYDNLHCSFSDGFQAVAGFASGIAGAYKYVGKVMES